MRAVNGITGNGITFASLLPSQSNPLPPSATGIIFNAYFNVKLTNGHAQTTVK